MTYDIDTLPGRLRRKVIPDPATGCWVGQWATRKNGYIGVRWKGAPSGQLYLHRLVYSLMVGPIPAGYTIDHTCHEKRCCNPEHLEAVTHRANAKDGAKRASATRRKPPPLAHCKRGHDQSVYRVQLKSGLYHCAECHRITVANSNERMKARARISARKPPGAEACPDLGPVPGSVLRQIIVQDEQTSDQIVGGCWIWTGTRTDNDYGFTTMRGERGRVHRHMYAALVGPIPDGYVVDHLCGQPLCCNPRHLRLLTNEQNSRLGTLHERAKRTHCKEGHPLSGDNLAIRTVGDRRERVCLTCERARSRAYVDANREKVRKRNREQMRRYRAQNPEKYRQYQREYRRRKRVERKGE